jgi:hypothetical protein
MEFDELQKIWDTQNNQPMYVINEQALHKRIITKKYHVIHIAGFTEWLLIIVNAVTGGFLLQMNGARHGYFFVYMLAAWLFGSVLYVLINRFRRLHDQHRFNRTLAGDLQHALAIAGYQVRIAHIMRWNVVPVGLLVLLSMWEGGKSVWLSLIVAFFFILVFFACRWELTMYSNKKQELEVLQQKLQEGGTQP